jgi:hypothetical protein
VNDINKTVKTMLLLKMTAGRERLTLSVEQAAHEMNAEEE